MDKSTHFSGQPLYSQVIKFMRKDRILQLSREHGSERYVKRFDCWTHLVVMLYAVIMRFDSLREITAFLQAEARKLGHLGIGIMPSHSTLSDANCLFCIEGRTSCPRWSLRCSSPSLRTQSPSLPQQKGLLTVESFTPSQPFNLLCLSEIA